MEVLTKTQDRENIRLRWYHQRSIELSQAYTNILDIGCGEGLILSKLGSKPFAVDISFPRLQSTKKYTRFLAQVDAQSLPFRSGTFDCIICHQTIEHVPNIAQLLREIHRILRTGGIMALSTPIPHFVSRLLARHRNARGETVLSEDHVSEFRSKDSLFHAASEMFHIQSHEEHWETKPIRIRKAILDLPLLYYYSDIYLEAKPRQI